MKLSVSFSNVTKKLSGTNSSKKDMYNMDETGFRINCGVNHLVMTMETKKIIFTDPRNRDYIISIEFIYAATDGWFLFAFLIIAGVHIFFKKRALKNEFFDSTVLVTSESIYANDELSMV